MGRDMKVSALGDRLSREPVKEKVPNALVGFYDSPMNGDYSVVLLVGFLEKFQKISFKQSCGE